MRYINISIISNNPKFLWGIFGDCINCMKNFFEQYKYKVILTENTFVEDSINIIWGIGTHYSKDYNTYLSAAKKFKTIFVNMEQLGSDSALLDNSYLELISQFRLIDYNFENLIYLSKNFGIDKSAEFPFTPYPLTAEIKISDERALYDYAFFGSINPRRKHILSELASKGVKIKIINGAYGDSLSKEISDCKALLNIHYYTTSLFEVARCLRPLAIGLPILSETSLTPRSIEWNKAGIEFYDYELITMNATNFLNDENLRRLRGRTKEFNNKLITNESILSILNLVNF